MNSTTHKVSKETPINKEVLAELALLEISTNSIRITRTLTRPLYVKVDEVLQLFGGKWDKKKKQHVFPGDPTEYVENAIRTGRVTREKDLGWFPTPHSLAADLIKRVGAHHHHTLLEPSAGEGAILDAYFASFPRGITLPLIPVTIFEIDPERCNLLQSRFSNHSVKCADFLTVSPSETGLFDRIVMNPPFAPGRADIEHITHAAKFLKPCGRLIAVASAGVLFRNDRKTETFRTLVAAHGGTIEDLPVDSFAASRTKVNTCVIIMEAL